MADGWSGMTRRAKRPRSEEHTSELQSQSNLVCRLLLEKKNTRQIKSLSLGVASDAFAFARGVLKGGPKNCRHDGGGRENHADLDQTAVHERALRSLQDT